ncbi:glycoside hydrolase family 38 C-terminal domain-containing protein [Nocardia ninae]|uniref:Alpha-mannosidase n=1 Tax=Nocardia ninae NBRC 108245 TaxID=1210091 RepID=A0A511MH79_9NOCA|nr:glycoside hydrolase family 38 C-terminal domain-containing protein [Nocardia ninae]GEM40030.1 alpha-mannosidase [Nocardia ninae NBRC 108245]
MHDDRRLIEDRLGRVLMERIMPAVYPESVPLTASIWVAPDEPVPVAEGLAAPRTPIQSGAPWGAPWGTSWLTVEGTVPAEWAGKTVEAIIDLGFDRNMTGFQCEGLVYRSDGSPVKGLHPRNQWVRVASPAVGGEQVLLHVEAASNPIIPFFAPNALGDKLTAGTEPQYRLGRMDLAVLDEEVWNLVLDLEVLGELMHEMPEDPARRFTIVRAIERALDAVDLQNVNATAAAARACLADVLAAPAIPSAHLISAVGHAHIDSAWLWPLRETVRKVARTTANMTALLADEPEFVFTMSQAAQYDFIKQHRPEVYAKVKEAVAAGRFVPTGGMWVEADTNMPGSEAMARQFVHGKRFFLEEFGVDNQEVWLPDTFGFAAGLPQIIKAAGAKWLLTQKISWSQINKFPHHTFLWEGVDGTRIFTHFPPVDTYNCTMHGREIAHAARNFKDKGRASRSLAPTGWGDGGGGTTREMVAKAARMKNLEGSPKVFWDKPAEFFAKAEAEYQNPPVWVGELYLELHRGTLTSQSKTKQGNRRSEHLLREAELWAATATVRKNVEYPYAALDRLWKTVLLHQFHDILPGSSIAWVHREAEQTYAVVAEELAELIERAKWVLGGEQVGPNAFNPAPHVWRSIPAGAAGPVAAARPCAVTERMGGGFVLDNGLLQVEVDARGLVVSVFDVEHLRETLPPGSVANLLQLHPDLPNSWDAWDVDIFYRNRVTDLADADFVVAEPDSGVVRIGRSFGSSTVEQTLTLHEWVLEIETSVDWHETEKFLKLAFPLDIHADRYASETQFGHLFRPTHTNTSWEYAKFEACAHRFVHFAEPGWGVALVNDATYGHDVTRTVRADGGTTTTVRASLLRAPRFPDPQTDHGVHRFRHALLPGAAIGDAVNAGYRVNLTPPTPGVAEAVEPLFVIDNDAVVTSAVKLADDGSGDVVLRVYEAQGGRASALVTPGFDAAGFQVCDLLERPLPADTSASPEEVGVRLRLRPFQLVTLRFVRSVTAE